MSGSSGMAAVSNYTEFTGDNRGNNSETARNALRRAPSPACTTLESAAGFSLSSRRGGEGWGEEGRSSRGWPCALAVGCPSPPALSPLVPHGERELALSAILRSPQ